MTVLNATVVSGDTITLAVTAKIASDGTVINLTGASIIYKAVKSLGAAASIEKSTASGISITNAAAGQFTVTLSPSDTANLSGTFLHEFQITISGNVYTLRDAVGDPGTLTIKRDIIT